MGYSYLISGLDQNKKEFIKFAILWKERIIMDQQTAERMAIYELDNPQLRNIAEACSHSTYQRANSDLIFTFQEEIDETHQRYIERKWNLTINLWENYYTAQTAA